jgi:hypothetical protein
VSPVSLVGPSLVIVPRATMRCEQIQDDLRLFKIK